MKKGMGKGFVMEVGMNRAGQHKENPKIPSDNHAVLIRDVSVERGELEILDVNHRTHGFEPFYWIPFSCIEPDKFIVFRAFP